jgi:ADP-heptose:LPS heptosyltransferase
MIVYETRRGNMPLVKHCPAVDLVLEEGSPLAWMCQRLFSPKLSLYPSLPDEYTPKRRCRRIHLTEEFRNSFGLPAVNAEPVRLEVNAKANKEVRKWLQSGELSDAPLVVIHTGPTWKTRQWPLGCWNELVELLRSEFRVAVVQIGQDSFANGDSGLSPRVTGSIDRVGKLSLDQSLALLNVADLFVGIDSGMLHLAGTVRTSCVGIFGPTDPSCRLPIGSPATGVTAQVPCIGCHHNVNGPGHWMTGCPHDIRCMSDLTVEEVFRACSNYLQNLDEITAGSPHKARARIER